MTGIFFHFAWKEIVNDFALCKVAYRRRFESKSASNLILAEEKLF